MAAPEPPAEVYGGKTRRRRHCARSIARRVPLSGLPPTRARKAAGRKPAIPGHPVKALVCWARAAPRGSALPATRIGTARPAPTHVPIARPGDRSTHDAWSPLRSGRSALRAAPGLRGTCSRRPLRHHRQCGAWGSGVPRASAWLPFPHAARRHPKPPLRTGAPALPQGSACLRGPHTRP